MSTPANAEKVNLYSFLVFKKSKLLKIKLVWVNNPK